MSKRYLMEQQVDTYRWIPWDADDDLYALLERAPRQDRERYRVLDVISKGMKSLREFHSERAIQTWKSKQHTRWVRDRGEDDERI